jgi:threonine/homoserine/homoserine lactone efflux protein
MSDQPIQKFSLLSYVSLILLLAPLLLVGALWVAFAAHLTLFVSSGGGRSDPALQWMVIAVAAGVVCVLSEWCVLPFVINRRARRPSYTPLISFAIGLLLSAAIWLASSPWR